MKRVFALAPTSHLPVASTRPPPLRNEFSPTPGSTCDAGTWYGAGAGTEVEHCVAREAR
jgi:hypothetical protein